MANAVLAMLIACRYFTFLPEFPSDFLGVSFLITSIFSHMTLLTVILGILLIPLLFLPTLPRRILISGFAALGLIALFIDTMVYAQYRFHINAVMLELVMSGQIVSFPLSTWLMTIFGIVLLWAVQYALIVWFEKAIPFPRWKLGKRYAYLTIITLLLSHGIHIWAAANLYQPVTVTKRYLPLFQPATSTKTMKKYGWVNEEALEKQKAMSLERKSDINYPLKPIQATVVEKPTNIVFIVIDSWRADSFNADNAPNMWQYAQQGKIFENHLSTGNCTRTGIFGMFYSMPGTYWHGILVNKQSPVFIDRLQEMNYQLGIFAAAKLTNPEFDRTVFSKVPNLRIKTEGKSSVELDQNITKEWLTWHSQQDKNKPSFSFLFYDSPHGYDFPKDYPHQYKPMLKEVNYLELSNDTDRNLMMNRYKTSVHYVDSLVKKVLDQIKAAGEEDHTLVIITGDHGQEVNDNKENFWGHNGNYTDAQVKVPLAIIGPKVLTSNMMQWNGSTYTSHQDLVPTLMKNFLGVNNDIQDYSVGEDLMGPVIKRDWILASNYSSYAVITPKTILEVGAVGQYDLLDKSNKPLKGQQPNFTYVQGALEQISRFSR